MTNMKEHNLFFTNNTQIIVLFLFWRLETNNKSKLGSVVRKSEV